MELLQCVIILPEHSEAQKWTYLYVLPEHRIVQVGMCICPSKALNNPTIPTAIHNPTAIQDSITQCLHQIFKWLLGISLGQDLPNSKSKETNGKAPPGSTSKASIGKAPPASDKVSISTNKCKGPMSIETHLLQSLGWWSASTAWKPASHQEAPEKQTWAKSLHGTALLPQTLARGSHTRCKPCPSPSLDMTPLLG